MELGKHAGVYNPISDRALLNELVKDYDNNYKNFKSKYAGDDTGSTETESTETAGNEENTTVEHKHSDSTSDSNSTTGATGSTGSSSDSDAYRKALSEIIDTLTSNNNSSTSTLNQVVNSLTN